MSEARSRGPARVEANLTAFIDVTFLLIIFFVLVAQISTTERPNLPLPQVEDRASAPLEIRERLVINCALGGEGVRYTVGSEAFSGEGALSRLAEIVRQRARALDDEPVSLRAERALAYEHVQPILDLLRELRVSAVELIVIPPQEHTL